MTVEPAASRRERERERHRQEIVVAAEAVILERGLEAATMEEIARRSQFAVGSLYRFFGSKEDLVEAVVVERSRLFAEQVNTLATAPDLDFAARLDRFLAAYAAELGRSFPLVTFLFSGTRPIPKPNTSSGLVAARQPLLAAVAALVASGQRDGALHDEDVTTVTLVLVSLLDGLSKAVWFSGRTDFETMIPAVRRAFLHGYGRTGSP